MHQGKAKCETLKAIRKKIADANEIPYEPVKCTHEGDCIGTCPACESEVRYIENQLNIRKMAGKAVKIVGLASVMTLATSVAANETTHSNESTPVDTIASTLVEDSEDEVWMGMIVEQSPQFPGGPKAMFEFLKENLVYPDSARKAGIQGKVIVSFVVEKDGSISHAEVVRGVDPALDAEAVRVVCAMPNWTPGTQRGKIARTKFQLPVFFKLPKSEE